VAGQRIGYVRMSALDQNEKPEFDGQILDRDYPHRHATASSDCLGRPIHVSLIMKNRRRVHAGFLSVPTHR
jgi:hypothetical protein